LFKKPNQALGIITYHFNNMGYLNSQRAIG
jgi:hypothetical protein